MPKYFNILKNLSLLFCFSLPYVVAGQIYEPVKWSNTVKHIKDNEFEVKFIAKIDKKWSVYSQFLEGDGPSPTLVGFDKSKHYTLVGKGIESGHSKKGYDPIWEFDVTKFVDEYIITQRMKVLDDSKPITGFVNFQACDDKKCLAPTDYNFKLSPKLPSNDKAQKNLEDPNIENNKKTTLNTTPNNPSTETNKIASADAPVIWTNGILKMLDKNVYQASFNVKIANGWNIYSKNQKENGPIPTKISFDVNQNDLTLENIQENTKNVKTAYDKYFKIDVLKIFNDANYQINFKSTVKKDIFGIIDFMACNNEKCLPLFTYFKINLLNETITFSEDKNSLVNTIQDTTKSSTSIFPINKIDLNNPISKCSTSAESSVSKKTNASIFILGFLGGLLALLTPCVFPLIPLTVSYFTKGSKSKKKGLQNAALYGFFIFMVYLVLSIPFHLLDSIDSNILNDISTNMWLNIAFFVIFIFFAFSFFGYYEITIPSRFTNKVSSAENVGGIIGIFFMALTLALVSFSCTGPILGTLLAGALTSDGGAWQLTSGMSGFGLALAMPFALFAAFPGWLNTLPKSGGWLNVVKVVLGFVEIALAFKFLSNADLVKHWGILKLEPFLIIWILCGLGLTAYLLGLIRFPHDSKLKKISPIRIVFACVSLLFSIYLMSGFRFDKETQTFTPLSLLSGLAPPVGYSLLYPKKCPQNLSCFHDLGEGLAYAKAKNLPIFLDFTGYACVNCRKMEEHVWPNKDVYNLLSNKYVVISLYVDDKEELPEDQKKEVKLSNGNTKILRTVGDKWAVFQTNNFNNNSQPLYALITSKGELLNTPVGYTPESSNFASFLKCGLDAFNSLNKIKPQE